MTPTLYFVLMIATNTVMQPGYATLAECKSHLMVLNFGSTIQAADCVAIPPPRSKR